MAVPVVITLVEENIKHTLRNGNYSKIVPLVVNSDTEILVGAVHKEEFNKLLFQISNEGVNSLDFAFYGASLDELKTGSSPPSSEPPDYDGTNVIWSTLPNNVGSVLTVASTPQTITDNWAWILITVKRTDTGLDTTGNLHIRGH